MKKGVLSPASVAPADIGAWASDSEHSTEYETPSSGKLCEASLFQTSSSTKADVLLPWKQPSRGNRAQIYPTHAEATSSHPQAVSECVTVSTNHTATGEQPEQQQTLTYDISREKQAHKVRRFDVGELMRKVRAATHGSLDIRQFKIANEASTANKWLRKQGPQENGVFLTWIDPHSNFKRSATTLPLSQVLEVETGYASAGFLEACRNISNFPRPDLCFSCVSPTRTVDIIANSVEQRDAWVAQIRSLIPAECREHDEPGEFSIFKLIESGHLGSIERILEDNLHHLNDLHPATGDSPLLHACRHNKPDVTMELLVRGASVDPHSRWGQTALQIAVDNGHLECVRTLLSAARKFGRAIDLVNTKCRDDKGRTAVHLASKRGDVHVLHLLLEVGGDPLALDKDMRSALHIAALAAGGFRKAGTYPHLQRYPHGYRPPKPSPPPATIMLHAQCIELLLNGGASRLINAGDSFARAALHYAAISGDVDMVEVFLKAGANPLIRDNTGATALDISTSRGFDEVSQLLQAAGEAADTMHAKQLAVSTPARRQRQGRRQSSTRKHLHYSDGESEVSSSEKQPVRKNRRGSAKKSKKRGLFVGLSQHGKTTVAPSLMTSYAPKTTPQQYEGWVVQTSDSASSSSQVKWLENLLTGEIMPLPNGAEHGHDNFAVVPPLPYATSGVRGVIKMPKTPPLFESSPQHRYQEEAAPEAAGVKQFAPVCGDDEHAKQRPDYNEAHISMGHHQSQQTTDPVFTCGFHSESWTSEHALAQPAEVKYDGPNGGFFGEDGYEYYHDEVNDQWYYFDYDTEGWCLWGDSYAEHEEHCKDVSSLECATTKDSWHQHAALHTLPHQDAIAQPMPTLEIPGTLASAAPPVPHGFCKNGAAAITPTLPTTPGSRETQDSLLQPASTHSQDQQLLVQESDEIGHQLKTDKQSISVQVVHEGQFAKYKRMLRMGIPLPAVQGKLKMDAVDDDEAARFVAAAGAFLCSHDKSELDDTPAEASTPCGALPLAAPSGETKHSHTPPAVNSDRSSLHLGVLQEGKFAKYKRMLRMGIPLPAVQGKLKMDAVDDDEAARFVAAAGAFLSSHDKSELDDTPTEAPPVAFSENQVTQLPGPSAATTAPKESKADLLKEEPELEKYAKMVKMGAPLGAAKGKMQQDGKAPALIGRFICAFARNDFEAKPLLVGLETTVKASRPLPSGPRPGPSSAAKRRARVQLLKLHWTPLPTDLVQSSVWGSSRVDSIESASELDESSLQELQERFAVKKVTAKSSAPKKVAAAPEAKTVYLIDSKRANNVGIGLAQFKQFKGAKGVLEAVLDPSGTEWAADGICKDCKVNTIQLEALLGLLPDTIECRTLSNFKGNKQKLGPVEKWFDEVRVIPRPAAKVHAALGLRQISNAISTCSDQAQLLLETNSRIMDSGELRAVLTTILAVGNAMNEGTANGGVSGFTLDSVLRLTATKAADKKTTLMDYVVEAVIIKQGVPLAAPTLELLRPLRKAKRIAVGDVVALLGAAKMSLQRAESEASKMEAGEREESAAAATVLAPAAAGAGAPPPADSDAADRAAQPPPANAFLASIRNAGVKRKKKAKPTATAATKPVMELLGSTCVAEFKRCVQLCAGTVKPQIDALGKLVDRVQESDHKLAQYFAEKDGSGRVHSVLAQFLSELHSSSDRLEAKLKREARSAAPPPTPPIAPPSTVHASASAAVPPLSPPPGLPQ